MSPLNACERSYILLPLALLSVICAGCGSGGTNTPGVPTFKLEYTFAQNVSNSGTVAVGSNGNVYTVGVKSEVSSGLVVITQLGKGQLSTLQFPTNTGTNGPLAISPVNGNIYGANGIGIVAFTASAGYIGFFREPQTAKGGVSAIAVDSKGDVYATDGSNILHYSAGGTYLGTIPVADAGYVSAVSLAIDSNNNFYVGDIGGVAKLSSSGKLLEQFSCSDLGGADGSIGIDGSGNIYTSSPYSSYIIRYSPTGTVTAAGEKDGGNIAVDSAGDVFTADTFYMSVCHASR